MKRAFLIAGGTLGGLGAVLAITPPQLSSNESAIGTGVDLAPATEPTASATTSASAAPTAEPSATTSAVATTSAKPTASKSATAKPATTQSATPEPVATKAASGKATDGVFLGDPSTMRYGTVQVQITINGGKITDAQAVQAPSGRDQRYTDRAVPVMRQKTLAAQSANITGVSGASYTAYAWYESLQSALKKAGWM